MVFHWRVDQRRNPNPQTSPIYATQNNRIRNIKLQESFWGLFVYLQVTGIFTGTVFSPSCAPRQFPSRYTIRARLNFILSLIILVALTRTSYPELLRALDYIFISRELSSTASERFRLPDPFIVYALRMILRNVCLLRCSSLLICSQISANCRKSFCFADLRGYFLKCGMTFCIRSSSFLTSYLSVRSPQSRRMCPQPKYWCIKSKTSRRSKF